MNDEFADKLDIYYGIIEGKAARGEIDGIKFERLSGKLFDWAQEGRRKSSERGETN